MTPENLPFVSICLLTYKRAHALSRTIDSILNQTHTNFELIINDDRSPDHTEQVCREYEKKDSRVKYYKNEKNLRYAGNQNAAIERASSDCVAILHDGDEYRPDLIEKWTSMLVKYPSAALVFNALTKLDTNGNPDGTHLHSYPELVDGKKLLSEMLLRPDSPIFGIVMVRKHCVLSVGPFDTGLPVLADVDMWMRLLAKYDAAYIKEPLISIAPREKNHPNNPFNWKIHAEHERIYQLNADRFYSIRDPINIDKRSRIKKMLQKRRIFNLLLAIKHLKWNGLRDGIIYCLSRKISI